jgi:hypothetical protein
MYVLNIYTNWIAKNLKYLIWLDFKLLRVFPQNIVYSKEQILEYRPDSNIGDLTI